VKGNVCIVVDVLRASSSIVTLLERGCERLVVAADIAEARRLHGRLTDHLLCGEAGGTPPDGFDYGNSPVEFSRLDLAGKSVILATTNGTNAIANASDHAAAVLVGCLLNRTAVARLALHLAKELDADVALVPANDGGHPASEDYTGASLIVESARKLRRFLKVGDFAKELASSRAGKDNVSSSRHANELRVIGLGEDVEYCAQIDISDVVPMLQPGEGGLLVLRDVRLPQT
jgi:2-phosphosulfolactate phosphatase